MAVPGNRAVLPAVLAERNHSRSKQVANNPTLTRPQDSHRVNVSQEHEIRYWTETFGVSAERLREAVQQVGPMVADVADFLAAEKRTQ
jgi:hypothetical protein